MTGNECAAVELAAERQDAGPIAVGESRGLKFGERDPFQGELRRRVDDYFRRTGRRPLDSPAMYFKTAVILFWYAASYALLVFAATTWWQALPLAVSLGLAMAAVGMNIQHDGGHQAYSSRGWVNRLAAMTMDLVGASSYIWRWKHGVFHHTFVNVAGHDSDIEIGSLGRLSPHQRRLGFHRWQHFYLWPLYGFLTIKWSLYDDFHDLIRGRVGNHKIPRPRGWDLVVFLAGKVIFHGLTLVVPLMLYPFWTVVLWYSVAMFILGVVLSVVFQLAHVVPQADFPAPQPGSNRMDHSWAVHQAETTVDFARRNWFATWYLGGLNFQIEHHLFPRVSHVHYPAISKIVEATCREFGVKYAEHRTFLAGVVSHCRWVKAMGAPA